MKTFRYSVGPWNIQTGADPFGPPVRRERSFEERLEQFKALGFDAIQFHDDDAVPEVDRLSGEALRKKARERKRQLDEVGLEAEFVAPRLWEDERTKDGAYTANLRQLREYANERSLKSLEIAHELGTRNIGIWLAREGLFVPESKSSVRSIHYIVEAMNRMLEQDRHIRIMIEPKPNEPVDRAFVPTVGHAIALAHMTVDPARVGVIIESAHAVLAGLDPAEEMAFALSQNKLWSVHLNDQNGLKFDQDRSFGSVNLRQAFNQIRILLDNEYGQQGEYVGLDVKALRTQSEETAYQHLENSLFVIESLANKVRTLDAQAVSNCINSMNYEQLDRLILHHLLS